MKDRVQAFYSATEVEALARACGFVERTSRLTGLTFLVTFTTGLLNTPNGTLAQLAAFLSGVGQAQVSPQAIDARLSVAAMAFLRCCLEQAFAMATRPHTCDAGLLAGFDHIYIIDSTNFELHASLRDVFKGSGGAGSAAAMRIQLVLDYLTGRLYVWIGDTKFCDAPTLQRVVEQGALDTAGRCLFLADLGYFKLATFQTVHQQGQFFLSKLLFGVALQDETGAALDLQALLKAAPDALDQIVTLAGGRYRLVGKKLPDAIINQRLRTANRAARSKRGSTITDAYRFFLQYALFLTNLPPAYDLKTLFTLYRIRWQIELVFKTWKSILAIHKIRSARLQRVMCEVYGKLILAALSIPLTAVGERPPGQTVLSLHRVMQHLRSIAALWACAILRGPQVLAAFLDALAADLTRLCRKKSQRTKPSIETRLQHALLSQPLPAVISP